MALILAVHSHGLCHLVAELVAAEGKVGRAAVEFHTVSAAPEVVQVEHQGNRADRLAAGLDNA